MLMEIGFRPNHHFPTSPSFAQIPHASHPREVKSRQPFSSSRKKKLMKRSLTMPYPEEGTREGRTSIAKCLETIESDLDRLAKHHSLNPFKGLRMGRKEGASRGKAAGVDSFVSSSARLAVEFPMIFNVGSIYSSHVVVYLDP